MCVDCFCLWVFLVDWFALLVAFVVVLFCVWGLFCDLIGCVWWVGGFGYLLGLCLGLYLVGFGFVFVWFLRFVVGGCCFEWFGVLTKWVVVVVLFCFVLTVGLVVGGWLVGWCWRLGLLVVGCVLGMFVFVGWWFVWLWLCYCMILLPLLVLQGLGFWVV